MFGPGRGNAGGWSGQNWYHPNMGSLGRLLPAFWFFLASVGYGEPAAHPEADRPDKVLTGIDVLERDGFQELQGRRIGLITNHTGRDSRGRSLRRGPGRRPRCHARGPVLA